MTQYRIQNCDTFHCEVSFEGISYDHFERTGHWSIWGIVKMFEAARLIGLYNNCFDYKTMTSVRKTLVVVKQMLKLQPEVHRNYNLFTTLRQKYTIDITEVGKTSYTFRIMLINEITGEYLGEQSLKYVLMDTQTRKSTPLPPSFVEKFARYQNTNGVFCGLQIKDAPNPPPEVHRLRVVPLYSDTDRNNHVNQAVYIRYCSDCATDAALSGFYRHFTSDMCWYPVLEMNIYHANESLPNEELTVETWQDVEDFRVIYFIIKRNQTILLKASALFHPDKSERRRNSKI